MPTDDPLAPMYPDREQEFITPERAQEMLRNAPLVETGVPLERREGVYVHSFKCLVCSLHVMTFSWLADAHRAGTIACPECGQRARFMHWRATLTENPDFQYSTETLTEIYTVHPWPQSVVLRDPPAVRPDRSAKGSRSHG
jgi:DNA-directed RNA polymerase subunit RPC12/RpoP